jgi:DNA replication protein DnaC
MGGEAEMMTDLRSALVGAMPQRQAGAAPPTVGETPCGTCEGVGFVRPLMPDGRPVPYGHPLFGKLLDCPDCDTAARQRMEGLRALSGMGTLLRRCTFENFEERPGAGEMFEAAQAWAQNPQGWLVLLGSYGSGKTHLAAAVVNHLEMMLRPVLFVVVPDLLGHLRATFGPDSEVEYDALFEAVRTVPVLALDDLAAENPTAWAQEKLYQILDYRTREELPTLITSNLLLEQFEGRLKTRLENRLLCRVVVSIAGDYRRVER